MTAPPGEDTRTGPAGRRVRLLPAGLKRGWTPYLWLVYLGFFFLEPVSRLRGGTMTVAYAAATGAALLVFLVSYFRGFWVEGRALLGVIAVQALLGVAMTPLNTGSSVFLIYAASFAGGLHPSGTAVRTILGIAALAGAASWLPQASHWNGLWAAAMPLIIGYASFHDAQLRRADDRLRLAHEQIERLAAAGERERIARDLHDLLGHTLSLIVLKSELAAKLAPRDAERASREIRDVEQVARRALKEVREAIRGYRTSLDDEIEQSRSILGAARIHALVDARPVALIREAEAALALALREAVTNVVRHSRARTCRVHVQAEDDGCTLVVEDDGRGIDAPEGSGLRGMRARVEAMGGTVRRSTGAADRGTRMEIRLPAGRS